LAAAVFAVVAGLGMAVLLAWLLKDTDTEVGPTCADPPVAMPQLAAGTAVVPVLYGMLFVAVLMRPLHQLELHLVVGALALVGFYLAPMPLPALRARLDWPTLLFIATLVAWQPMLSRTGVDVWLMGHLPMLAQHAHGSLVVNLLILALLVGVVRLVVPGAPAFIVLATSFLPLAPALGLSPWALGFVLLTLSEGFVLAHQHGVLSHLLVEAQAHGLTLEPRRLLWANFGAWVLRVLALVVCVPWWQQLALA
jgi:divalent anion:Na+ symporter, DASS family